MMAAVRGLVSKLLVILEMIKFEHTVFALPFALTSAMLAADGLPRTRVLLWILAAMVGARSCAMAFNRIVDVHFDRLNPRTADRALPTGAVTMAGAWALTVVSAALLVVAAWQLNPLAFALSPIALLVVMGYSYTKRFTAWSHLILGLALGIAPVGAWIAVRGRIELAPMILSAAVIVWTAGFDIIYSLMDLEFDEKMGLFSIPRALGVPRALLVSKACHFAAVLLLAAFGAATGVGYIYYAGVLMAAFLLALEQSLVRPDDLSRVNLAFFNVNGFMSIGFFCMAALDLVVRKAVG